MVRGKHPLARLNAVYSGNGAEVVSWRIVTNGEDVSGVFADPDEAWRDAIKRIGGTS
jgi:hypothetical protein